MKPRSQSSLNADSAFNKMPEEIIVQVIPSHLSSTNIQNLRHSCQFFYTSEKLREIQKDKMKIIKIAAGWNHSLVLTDEGLFSCGLLGLSDDRKICPTFQKIKEFDTNEVLDMAAGEHHNVVITTNGVFVWGSNVSGQLGLGHNETCAFPQKVPALENKKVLAIAAGNKFTLMLTEDGLYSCGENFMYGQLGLGHKKDCSTPQLITFFNGRKVVAIAAGAYHALALTEEGTLYAFGRNEYGALGLGHVNDFNTPQQILTNKFTKVLKIAAGNHHTLVLTDEGLFAWGLNDASQLGGAVNLGHNVTVPQKVHGLTGKKIIEIDAGLCHSLALTDGGFFCWGLTGVGLLNTGLRQIDFDMKKIISISAKLTHNMILTHDGELFVFGENQYGQLGLGHKINIANPTRVNSSFVLEQQNDVHPQQLNPI